MPAKGHMFLRGCALTIMLRQSGNNAWRQVMEQTDRLGTSSWNILTVRNTFFVILSVSGAAHASRNSEDQLAWIKLCIVGFAIEKRIVHMCARTSLS